MINRWIISAYMVLISTVSFAQQVDLTADGIDNDGYNEARVIGQDEEGFYVLESNLPMDMQRNRIGFKTRKLRVAYFDGTLKPKWTLPVTPSQDNGTVDQVVFAFNRLLFISSSESKSQPEMEMWIREINNHGTGPAPGNKVAAFAFERSSGLDKVKFISSTGQHAAMLILKESTNGKQLLHTVLLDSALKPVSVKNLMLDYSEKDLDIEDYRISNNGDLAILGFLNRKEKDKEGDKIKVSEYHLFTIGVNENTVTDNAVKSEEKTLAQAGLVIDNLKQHAVVMGFYNDKNSFTGTGIFYGTAAFTKSALLEVQTHSVDGSQQIKMIGERNSNNSSGISSYPVQKIILRNDGGAVIIAEAAYTSEYSYYDYFTQSLIRHIDYHFDNVIVVSVNKDCTIDWSTVVHKRQESTDDNGMYSSFCPLINPDEIIIVYNKDLERTSSVSSAVISNRGEQKEMEISKSAEHLFLLPTWGKQISENEVIVPAYQKKKLFLSKISF